MKIALVHDWLTGMRGGEKILEVFCSLFPSADIFTLLHFSGSVSPEIEKHKIFTSYLQNMPFIKNKYRYYLPLMPGAIESFDLSGYELVISSSHCVAKSCRPGGNAVHICYSHTPMRYIWDQYENYFGKGRVSPLIRMGMNLIRKKLQKWDVDSAQRTNEFIANSQFVAKRIQMYYGRASTVIHPFVDSDFFIPLTPVSPLPSPDYYLIVSALAPYKRIELAIEAFNQNGKKLKIVGTGQWQNRLKARAKSNIEFLNWLSDNELRTQYQNCKALIFPGVEDFGIVPLEAMACGKPVIAYKEGGVTESVVDGQTGVFFSEQTSVALPFRTSRRHFLAEARSESLNSAVEVFEQKSWEPSLCREQSLKFSKENFINKFKRFLTDKAPKFDGL